jgi:hypothetical protein
MISFIYLYFSNNNKMETSKEILKNNNTNNNNNNSITNEQRLNEQRLNETNMVNDYISQLTPLQLKAYQIAKEHLKTSFDITRSNGYQEWLHK